MSFREKCAILAVDPYWLTPEQIRQLDAWQLDNIYFCARDERGRPVPDPAPEGAPNPVDDLPEFEDYEVMFRYAMEREGRTPEEIDNLVRVLGVSNG